MQMIFKAITESSDHAFWLERTLLHCTSGRKSVAKTVELIVALGSFPLSDVRHLCVPRLIFQRLPEMRQTTVSIERLTFFLTNFLYNKRYNNVNNLDLFSLFQLGCGYTRKKLG